MAEAGLPGFEAATWFALLAPAGTPREIITRLNALTNQIGQEMHEAIAKQGAESLGGTPEQVAAHITSEVAKWAKVVAASGARAMKSHDRGMATATAGGTNAALFALLAVAV